MAGNLNPLHSMQKRIIWRWVTVISSVACAIVIIVAATFLVSYVAGMKSLLPEKSLNDPVIKLIDLFVLLLVLTVILAICDLVYLATISWEVYTYSAILAGEILRLRAEGTRSFSSDPNSQGKTQPASSQDVSKQAT
jgi:heme/copper-type cytochrome/quinol oxidase subunit 2